MDSAGGGKVSGLAPLATIHLAARWTFVVSEWTDRQRDYSYSTAGLLSSRTLSTPSGYPIRATTITSRDGTGRILGTSTTMLGQTRLTETLSWTGDGLPAAHTLARSDFTNNAAYFYADSSRRLIEERLNLDGTKRWTNLFTYDGGQSSRSGVLTKTGGRAPPGLAPPMACPNQF